VDKGVNAIVNGTMDSIILRCIAKISFNYLAKIAGIDFVVKKDFDPIRSYIRYEIDPGHRIVTVSTNSILAYDGPKQYQIDGHLISLGWSPDNRQIVGQVSLFNQGKYRIILSKNFSELWRADIRRGYHFNIENREVELVIVVSRALYGIC